MSAVVTAGVSLGILSGASGLSVGGSGLGFGSMVLLTWLGDESGGVSSTGATLAGAEVGFGRLGGGDISALSTAGASIDLGGTVVVADCLGVDSTTLVGTLSAIGGFDWSTGGVGSSIVTGFGCSTLAVAETFASGRGGEDTEGGVSGDSMSDVVSGAAVGVVPKRGKVGFSSSTDGAGESNNSLPDGIEVVASGVLPPPNKDEKDGVSSTTTGAGGSFASDGSGAVEPAVLPPNKDGLVSTAAAVAVGGGSSNEALGTGELFPNQEDGFFCSSTATADGGSSFSTVLDDGVFPPNQEGSIDGFSSAGIVEAGGSSTPLGSGLFPPNKEEKGVCTGSFFSPVLISGAGAGACSCSEGEENHDGSCDRRWLLSDEVAKPGGTGSNGGGIGGCGFVVAVSIVGAFMGGCDRLARSRAGSGGGESSVRG